MSIGLEIERAIAARADWYRCPLIPEAAVRCVGSMPEVWFAGTPSEYTTQRSVDYMADFMSVSDAGYATEYEVKISRSDWRVDMQKDKWKVGLPDYISRFVYVVPEELGIPEWVNPLAGVWHLRTGGNRHWPNTYIVVARQAKRIGKVKVPDKVLKQWMSCFYYRYWRQRSDLQERVINQRSDRRYHERELERYVERFGRLPPEEKKVDDEDLDLAPASNVG